MLSTVAARRVVTHLGPPRFTNLYISNVARSSIWTKTTAAAIGGDVLAAAGLRFLLAPDECTPQAYVVAAANSGGVDWDRLTPERDAQARLEIAFAAQRGWAYDEFGMKVDAMMRDNGPMAEFRGLLRRLDDCPDRYEYVTMGRGSAVMDRPYLALLASMTPADMVRHARGAVRCGRMGSGRASRLSRRPSTGPRLWAAFRRGAGRLRPPWSGDCRSGMNGWACPR